MSEAAAEARHGLREIPRGIWALGFVSLFMDVSSEMIHALLPLFLTSALGASFASVGWIEGGAEATASFAKVFSGVLSDRLGKRKILAAIGYGLAAATKPLFALATSVGWVVSARVVDRLGKGIRGAPRDALVGDLSPPQIRGASYGLRQSLDTIGALVGPLLATLLMAASGGAFRFVFWVAVVPAFASLALILFGVREPDRREARAQPGAAIHAADARQLGSAYWWIVAVAAVFTLARFSEAFLILRAHSVGVSAAHAPLVFVVMNAVYSASSYPIGRLSDRVDRHLLLAAGFAVLALSQLALALASGAFGVALGAALWGLHMGMTQGVFAALVADAAPATLRGVAFGVFGVVTGVATLLASAVAGSLWERFGAPATFFAGAALTGSALAGFAAVRRRLAR